jgi:hypothetical protein
MQSGQSGKSLPPRQQEPRNKKILPASEPGPIGRGPLRTSERPEKSPALPERLRPQMVPRGSQRDPDIRRNVSRYVESLIKLYEMTDPAQGPASEHNIKEM